MPRSPREIVPHCPHHVTHRSNGREIIFPTPEDYSFYSFWLQTYATQCGLQIWAHCLMPNHIHLVVVPPDEHALSAAIGQTDGRYARRANRGHGSSGHLWGERFFAVAMDEAHTSAAVKYVELNPVRARLSEVPSDWRWSSARAHLLGAPDPLLLGELPLGWPKCGDQWAAYLAEGVDDRTLARLRRGTIVGHPLGSAEFLRRIREAKA